MLHSIDNSNSNRIFTERRHGATEWGHPCMFYGNFVMYTALVATGPVPSKHHDFGDDYMAMQLFVNEKPQNLNGEI